MSISFCSHCGHQTYGHVKDCPMCGGEIRCTKSKENAQCQRCNIALNLICPAHDVENLWPDGALGEHRG